MAITVTTGYDGSDHLPFVVAGIPAASFVREGPALDYIHTSDDTLDLIELSELGRFGNYLMDLIKMIASESTIFPINRTIPFKQEKEIIKFTRKKDWPL